MYIYIFGMGYHMQIGQNSAKLKKYSKAKRQTKYLRSKHFSKRSNFHNMTAKRPSSQPWAILRSQERILHDETISPCCN